MAWILSRIEEGRQLRAVLRECGQDAAEAAETATRAVDLAESRVTVETTWSLWLGVAAGLIVGLGAGTAIGTVVGR